MISFSVNAYSFGSVSQGSNRISETNVSFQIDLLNLNNRTLELEPSVEGLEKGNVSFPSNRIIEPSEISENPEGDGWISIEPGRYARPETFRFNVISSPEETGKDNFKFQIEARNPGQGGDSDVNQRVVQVREYSYEIDFPEEEVNPSVDRGFEDFEESEDGPEIIRRENDEENVSKSSTRENVTINTTEFSQTTKTSDNSTSTEPSNEIDSFTMMLSAGIIGSIAYLWMIL